MNNTPSTEQLKKLARRIFEPTHEEWLEDASQRLKEKLVTQPEPVAREAWIRAFKKAGDYFPPYEGGE